jgi:hypothetical protein
VEETPAGVGVAGALELPVKDLLAVLALVQVTVAVVGAVKAQLVLPLWGLPPVTAVRV